MPGPSVIFSFLVATLLGSSFHLLAGGDARRLALFLLAGWVGFALGQILGDVLNLTALSIGALHMFSAVSGAVIALLSMWLMTRRIEEG